MEKVWFKGQRDEEVDKLPFRGILESSRAIIDLGSEKTINQTADSLVTNASVCEMLEV